MRVGMRCCDQKAVIGECDGKRIGRRLEGFSRARRESCRVDVQKCVALKAPFLKQRKSLHTAMPYADSSENAEGGIRTHALETGLKHFECFALLALWRNILPSSVLFRKQI